MVDRKIGNVMLVPLLWGKEFQGNRGKTKIGWRGRIYQLTDQTPHPTLQPY